MASFTTSASTTRAPEVATLRALPEPFRGAPTTPPAVEMR